MTIYTVLVRGDAMMGGEVAADISKQDSWQIDPRKSILTSVALEHENLVMYTWTCVFL